MKKIVNIIIMLYLCSYASAQVISGFVYDKDTNQPISDVCVYLDGTSINTLTDASGRFELQTKSVINTKLVLFRISYYPVIIERPLEELPDILYLKERDNILKEVTVLGDCFTREQKMEAFREQFLGTSKAGKSCIIQNEGDITLSFDMQTRILSAASDKPVIVVNKYLGYQVSFTLVDFNTAYPYVSDCKDGLTNKYVGKTVLVVTSSYTDLYPGSKKIKRNRDEIYRQSSNYFFKSLINNTLKDNGFQATIKSIGKNNSLDYFIAKDTLSLTFLSINPEYREIGRTVKVSRKNKWSDIHFFTDSLLVDSYGNIDRIYEVAFTGEMGKNRAGDLLPIDYEP